jgi:hypothetical protein
MIKMPASTDSCGLEAERFHLILHFSQCLRFFPIVFKLKRRSVVNMLKLK